jgi:hypothetical protein
MPLFHSSGILHITAALFHSAAPEFRARFFQAAPEGLAIEQERQVLVRPIFIAQIKRPYSKYPESGTLLIRNRMNNTAGGKYLPGKPWQRGVCLPVGAEGGRKYGRGWKKKKKIKRRRPTERETGRDGQQSPESRTPFV